MKRISPWLAALLCLGFIAVPLLAATAASPSTESSASGAKLASTISQVTGIAISPLLGVSALGAYKYFSATTEGEKADLPWYGKPMYWLSGLLIVGAIAFKDIAGAAVPTGMKKPLDVLETMENKLSGLVAAGAVIPFSMDTLSSLISSSGGPSAALPIGLAAIHLGAADISWLLNILMVPLGIAVFLMVWLTAHTINVLIILSPWGAVDAVLKSIRLSVLGLLTITSWIDPWTGAFLSIGVMIVAFFCAGWAFRLTIYGTIFCWDFFTRRRNRFEVDPKENWVFTARKIAKTPVRTYGRLSRNDAGKLVLNYRPWLVLPERQMEMPDVKLSVGKGAFYPTVVGHFGDKERTLILLSPRYKGHEPEFGAACGINTVIDVGLRRAWAAIKDLFGFGVSNPSPVGA